MKRLVQLIETIVKKQLNESGYARIALIMKGLVKSINTFGVVTAMNKNGKNQSSKENNQQNDNLKKVIRQLGYGYQTVIGYYGNKEQSFFIPNITKKDILTLGEMFDQESILYGSKVKTTKDNKSYNGMKMQMIYTDERFGKVISERNVFINDNDAKDFFTIVKGRKFIIPFFDDSFEIPINTQKNKKNGKEPKRQRGRTN